MKTFGRFALLFSSTIFISCAQKPVNLQSILDGESRPTGAKGTITLDQAQQFADSEAFAGLADGMAAALNGNISIGSLMGGTPEIGGIGLMRASRMAILGQTKKSQGLAAAFRRGQAITDCQPRTTGNSTDADKDLIFVDAQQTAQCSTDFMGANMEIQVDSNQKDYNDSDPRGGFLFRLNKSKSNITGTLEFDGEKLGDIDADTLTTGEVEAKKTSNSSATLSLVVKSASIVKGKFGGQSSEGQAIAAHFLDMSSETAAGDQLALKIDGFLKSELEARANGESIKYSYVLKVESQDFRSYEADETCPEVSFSGKIILSDASNNKIEINHNRCEPPLYSYNGTELDGWVLDEFSPKK